MDGQSEIERLVGVQAGSFVVTAPIIEHGKVVVTKSVIFSEPQYAQVGRDGFLGLAELMVVRGEVLKDVGVSRSVSYGFLLQHSSLFELSTL